MEVMADTTVLIDIWRYGKTPRRLGDLTSKLKEAAILVPWITQAEFSRGALFKCVSLETLAEFYKSFHLVPLDQATMNAYCQLWAEMARAGHEVRVVTQLNQRAAATRVPSAGDTANRDELRDDLEKWKHPEEMAELFFAAKTAPPSGAGQRIRLIC